MIHCTINSRWRKTEKPCLAEPINRQHVPRLQPNRKVDGGKIDVVKPCNKRKQFGRENEITGSRFANGPGKRRKAKVSRECFCVVVWVPDTDEEYRPDVSRACDPQPAG